MKILSLFDGISCGMVALKSLNIPIERYCAFEIDKDAVKVSKDNFNNIEYYGDVTQADFTEFADFDLLIGGSPCSFWSNARANRTDKETKPDGRGYKLFMEFVRAKNESRCRYFMYENNYSISQQIKDAISDALGVKPILINSADFTAQNRKRLYWTNIPITNHTPKDIKIGDVISKAINGAAFRNQIVKGVLTPQINIRKDNKSNCLIAYMCNKNCCVQEQSGNIRPLSLPEFEILQGLPMGYTSSVGESKGKQLIALGWTIDVIKHIFSYFQKK